MSHGPWQQSFALITQPLLVADHPRGGGAASGSSLLSMNPTEACPLAYCERTFAYEFRKLVNVVVVLDPLPLNKDRKQLLDPCETLINVKIGHHSKRPNASQIASSTESGRR
jgi:hypothetical protein